MAVMAVAVSDVGAAAPASARFGATSCAASPAATVQAARSSAVGRSRTGAAARLAAQVTRNEKVDATFEVRPSAAGGIEVSMTSGDLRVTKTVQGNGEFSLEVTSPRDTVSVLVNGQATQASRGRDKVRLPRAGGQEADEARVRRMMADSDSVVRFRRLAAGLLDSEDRSPAGLAIIMADATLGMMSGDVGAPRRVAKFLAHGGASKGRPASMAIDCFYTMEDRMMEAFNDYGACYSSVWPNPLLENMCGYRWLLQVESYWFSFITCSGFNGF